MMIGAWASRAAIRAATTLLELITFTAGSAHCTLFMYPKSSCSAEPVTMPVLSFIFAMRLPYHVSSYRRVSNWHVAGQNTRVKEAAPAPGVRIWGGAAH